VGEGLKDAALQSEPRKSVRNEGPKPVGKTRNRGKTEVWFSSLEKKTPMEKKTARKRLGSKNRILGYDRAGQGTEAGDTKAGGKTDTGRRGGRDLTDPRRAEQDLRSSSTK
jgi:hypothetical protein